MQISNQLLNYMYQQGYTEEDMYDEKTIVKAAHAFIAHMLAQGFRNVWETVKRVATQLWEAIKPVAVYFEEIGQDRRTEKPFINIKPIPLMSHQVIDRKPRYQVRKIIK